MTTRAQLLQWTERGHLPPHHLERALRLTGSLPTDAQWQQFLSRLLLAAGTLLLGSGIIFFFAYNWNSLPRFARFGLVEGLLLASTALAWWKTPSHPVGRAALFLSALLTGALFALIGQTYQTGADPWELFALWSVLLLPWAFVARQPDLWLLSLLLANVALGLQPWYRLHSTWQHCALNLAALAAWELLAPQPRLAPRLAGAATGVSFTLFALGAIFSSSPPATAFLYLLWLPATIYVYVQVRRDLFMIAGALLSSIVTITALCLHSLSSRLGDSIFTLFLIATLVIALSGASAKWLQHLAREDRV